MRGEPISRCVRARTHDHTEHILTQRLVQPVAEGGERRTRLPHP